MNNQTKKCKKCGKTLPIDEFSKSSNCPDGHLSTCKICRGAGVNTPETIHCPVCNKNKPYYDFKISGRSENGRMWACKECIENKPKEISDTSYRNKYDISFHEKTLISKNKEFHKNIKRYILNRAKYRAETHNLEFNLDLEDIIIPEYCPLLEVRLELGNSKEYEYSPSIDRIDNSKGYIKGNVWIISKKANSMKNSATPEELKIFCKNIIRYSLNITKQ